jgi:hypothetical protein
MSLCTHALENYVLLGLQLQIICVLGQEQIGNAEIKTCVGQSDYVIMKLCVDLPPTPSRTLSIQTS